LCFSIVFFYVVIQISRVILLFFNTNLKYSLSLYSESWRGNRLCWGATY